MKRLVSLIGRTRASWWPALAVPASWAALLLTAAAQPELIGKSREPIKGANPIMGTDAIQPGRLLVDPPTLENLGFRWFVSGDRNRNATVAVAFREKGGGEWTEALPMLRNHYEIVNQDYGPYRVGNLFAGSVLFLKPGSEYEVRLTMSDPDGGAPAPKFVTLTTRSEPKTPAGGRSIHVRPPAGLMTAYAQARPGDLILLHPGVYKGPFELKKSGLPGRPIVFRGVAGAHGGPVLEGDGGKRSRIVSIGGTHHLMFENLAFRNAHTAIYSGKAGSEGITVRRCRIDSVVIGINTLSENSRNWVIADNEIVGTNPTWYPRPREYMSPAHTGVNVYGQGHVVCHNRISRFSDALAIANFGPPVDDVERHCVAIDFYGNDLSWAQDDTLETDYGCHNVRVYRNRCYNTHTALSVQPFYGGPVYLIRNEAYGITALNFKLNNYPAGILAYNNTVCAAGQGFTPPAIWQNGHFRNNLFMGGKRYAMESGSPTPYSTLDYNGYRRNSPEQFLKWIAPGRKVGRHQSIEELHRATGLEKHGLEVDYAIFANAEPPREGKTYTPNDYDLRLKPGAKCIDRGTPIPQVTNRFTGSAPDLGCYEHRQSLPHYGPR